MGDGTTVTRITPVKLSEAAYDWKVGTPAFNFPAGLYSSVINVTLTEATAGATIHYSTNGADPTEADPTVASGGAVTVSQSLTLKARAWKSGMPASNVDGYTYTLKVPLISISPGTNTYNVNQNVTATSSLSGVTIHYTLNGVDPAESDPVVASGGTVARDAVVDAQGQGLANRLGDERSQLGRLHDEDRDAVGELRRPARTRRPRTSRLQR